MLYRMNVNPDVDHELTDAEVADLKSMGFEVTKAGGEQTDDKSQDQGTKAPARTEKKGA